MPGWALLPWQALIVAYIEAKMPRRLYIAVGAILDARHDSASALSMAVRCQLRVPGLGLVALAGIGYGLGLGISSSPVPILGGHHSFGSRGGLEEPIIAATIIWAAGVRRQNL
jgi:hypothetical protein